MLSISWTYEFVGAARIWAVSIMFCLVGLLCAVLVPLLLSPSAPPRGEVVQGRVLRIELEDGMQRAIFEYADPAGEPHELVSGFASNRSPYRVGEPVQVMFDPDDAQASYVVGDKDLTLFLIILRILGVVFGSLGLTLLAMKLRGMDDQKIAVVGGTLGALAYAIPSTLALPALWLAYQRRPNALFELDAVFGMNQWLIGAVFSGTGLLVLVGLWLFFRYQAKSGY